jgi:NAD+ synthase
MNARPADSLKIALAQLNPTVGSVAGNADKVRRARDEAAKMGADVVAFPELFLAGYPPEDLVLKPAFQAACRSAVEALARESKDGPALLVGTPWVEDGKLYNAYVLLSGGGIEAVRFKVDLPNYGVFDEKRVFVPGPLPGPILIKGVRIGIPICEDIWGPEVVECLSETGGEILLVPNGSPYWRGKTEHRLNIAVARVVESGLPLIYLNMVGGQDELVFDGASFVLNPDRSLGAQLPTFRESVALTEWRRENGTWRCVSGPLAKQDENEKTDYAACVLGIRDYVEKSGFKGVVIGLSGGIDSALCAAMAVDALGPSRVRCVMLPYRFTSQESLTDAGLIAKALGIQYDILPIEHAVAGLEKTLDPLFAGRPRDVTEENLQARARGTILMAISNKFGLMVVTTGNKSEMSVGYATLYGDMNGGFNPVKDLYKTQVFSLARLRNAWKPQDALGPDGEVIPENVIVRPPTAELRENQKDEDSLPPYSVLDRILERLVEREDSVAAIVAAGFDRDTVLKVERLLHLAEYKRRQACPGVKVTLKNFGRDRRYPIVNRFRDAGTPLPEPDRSLLKPGAASKTEAFDF